VLPEYDELVETIDPATARRARSTACATSIRCRRASQRSSTTDGRPRRIKLHDKLAALTILIKHLGGLPDERPVRVPTRRSTSSPTSGALMTMIARAKSSGKISSAETRSAVAQSAHGNDEISWHDDK
jgi:hypothetical protein